MARKADTQHPTWKLQDVVDMHPYPGAFISPGFSEFEPFDGVKVVALNWCHAEYMAVKQICRQVNEEKESHCEQCGHYVRFACVLRDEIDGSYHVTGTECLGFIESQMDRKSYKKLEFLKSIKKLDTKNGERYTYSTAVDEFPVDLWAIPREQRPKFLSFRKGERRIGKRGRGGVEPCWYVTIWGEYPQEVLYNYTLLVDGEMV